MPHPRTPLKTLAVWALCGLTLGTLAAGCQSAPPPPPPQETTAPPPPPPPMPVANQSQEPTAADVAAARPKDIHDPFTKPDFKKGDPSQVPTTSPSAVASATPKNHVVAIKAPTPAPTPKVPPTPPTVVAVGIFASKHGPEAILADKAGPAGGGTIIVTTGTRLKDGGYVKSIDPVSRKVVIDKEDTDFVLPLEAPLGSSSPSTPGK